ncbi:MAG: RNA polymerase sigma-70 factor [Bacteroides sp.]|nr:RNA polymerase sigma-70 factor [Bacteroides sp.]
MNRSEPFNLNKDYHLYYRKSYLFAKSYVHDSLVAEDIASEALTVLWQTMKKNEIHYPLTFLLSIVKNKSIDFLRREIVRQETLATLSDVGRRELNTRISTLEACEPEKIYSEELNQIIEGTLKTLPQRTREIFLMSRYQGFSKEEIAETFNITTKGVEYHIARALKSLRINLKDYLPIFLFLFVY